MKKYIQILSILGLLFLMPSGLKAQPEFDDEPVDAPIDAGILLLATAGLVYGFKKLKKEKN